ncbi:hypothetical protein [Numidum massiliense]|uniref:hypothetical protein n=1 Tax=Numidum massiliense TaxID=1522315 RepID=UPI00164E2B80|nr:hypothetical protein [Numidum massiliense]
MEDWNETPKRKPRRSKLDPYKETIDEWQGGDLKAPRKQKHTSGRVYERLKEMRGEAFNVSLLCKKRES